MIKSTVPSGPAQNLNSTVLSSEEAVITWDAPDVADQNGIITGYVINVTLAGTGQTFQMTSSTNDLYLTNLQPFTTYTCRVAAMTNVGVGPYSIAISFLTEESGMKLSLPQTWTYFTSFAIYREYQLTNIVILIAPSSPPQNVSGSPVSSTSVRLSWDAPPLASRNGIITEYRVNVTEVDTGRVSILTSFTTSFVAQSLHPYYTYLFTVSAHTVATGPYSTSVMIRTPEDSK